MFEAAIPIAIIAVGVSGAAKRKNALGENVIIQSIGASSGVIVAGAIFTLPALYILQETYPAEITVTFTQVFISSLLGGVLGILFLIPFRKYFVSDMHGKYPFPEATATTQVLVSGEKGGSQAKPLLLAGIIGGLYDFIVATFGWWNENFTTRVCGFGEMLADKAKLVFKVNTGAAVLGLGYIVGLKICFYHLCRFTGCMVDYHSGNVHDLGRQRAEPVESVNCGYRRQHGSRRNFLIIMPRASVSAVLLWQVSSVSSSHGVSSKVP